MSDFLGWATIVFVFAMVPMMLVLGLRHVLSRKPVERKYQGMSSGGLVGVFDAVWSPSAHEASMERDREQRRSVPAPTPDKGPGRIADGTRITIDL